MGWVSLCHTRWNDFSWFSKQCGLLKNIGIMLSGCSFFNVGLLFGSSSTYKFLFHSLSCNAVLLLFLTVLGLPYVIRVFLFKQSWSWRKENRRKNRKKSIDLPLIFSFLSWSQSCRWTCCLQVVKIAGIKGELCIIRSV